MNHVMLEFKNEIEEKVKELLDVDRPVSLETPSPERGDYALPCFDFASLLKKAPDVIAKELVQKIDLKRGDVEQSGPYINFSIDTSYLVENTLKSCLEGTFGRFPHKDESVIIEHTSANPNAPLHVGNARNPIIGDTLARIYRRLGFDVITEYYVDDMGRQVAILTWALDNIREDDLPEPDYNKPDHEMARYYQHASSMVEKDDEVLGAVQSLIQRMEEGDEEVIEAFIDYSKKVLEGHKDSLARLNIFQDSYKTESSLVLDGEVKKTVDELRESKVCGDEDGALYLPIGDDRIFLTRSDGTSLYPARDIAYHIWKSRRADRLIDVLGEDHKSHARIVKKALESLNISPLPSFIFYSFVSLEGEKMSTRSARSVWLDELMDNAEERAKEEILTRRDDLQPDQIEKSAREVGMGAVRFNIIRVQPEKHMDFRWEDALNFQGSSAPFVQYTHARACSILRKWGGDEEILKEQDGSLLDHESEIKLVKTIAKYPEVLLDSMENSAPHLMAKYAVTVASEFNLFYRDCPVLQGDEKTVSRLSLVKAYKEAISIILDTLGISAPEYM